MAFSMVEKELKTPHFCTISLLLVLSSEKGQAFGAGKPEEAPKIEQKWALVRDPTNSHSCRLTQGLKCLFLY
jgi:hypothetical protein